FTDVFLRDSERRDWIVHKVPSTPPDFADGFQRGFDEVLHRAGVSADACTRIIHGTTVGTNCILTQSGARLGLLLTEGFRDVLYIGVGWRPKMYDLNMDPVEPLFLAPRRYKPISPGGSDMRLKLSKTVLISGLSGLVLAGPLASAQEIDEVVVTATKRERSVQEVNIAINAFSAEDLGDFGWTDVTQVAAQSPNLEIKYAWGNSMPIYTIRGVGMNSFQASDTPGVGLFVDEIFQVSMVNMGTQLYDMERVEVLKGPQSSLFGRNTNGGAVSYISRKPSRDFDAFVRADVGRYERIELEGAVGGPLGDNTSGRVSFLTVQQGEGWVHDRTSGQDVGEVDIFAARAQLLFEPSDTLSINLKAFMSRDQSQPVYFQHIGFWNQDFQAGVPGAEQYCNSFAQGRQPDPNECVDILGYSDTDGDPYAGDYTNDPTTPITADAELDNEQLGITATIVKDFANGMQLTSLSNFQTYDRFQPKESDGNPELFVDLQFGSDVEMWSQEFRLASNTEGNFNWIAGLIVASDEVTEDPPRIIYADAFLGFRTWQVYSQDRDSFAVFGHTEWQINDQWMLTVGARYIDESMDFEEEVALTFGPDHDPANRVTLVRVPNPALEVFGKLDSDEVTGRVALDFKPNDEMLFYLSFNRGYKSGGFNSGTIFNNRQQVPFDPEIVNAWEVGMKSTLADGRVQFNAAAFVYDYEGMQAATAQFDDVLMSPVNRLVNLEAADVSGLEAEIDWMPTDQLQIRLGLGYLDTDNNDPGANFDGVFGNAERILANSPELSLNAALGYDVPMSGGATLRFFTDFAWQDEHYKEVVNNLLVESQSLWNARVSWIAPDNRWRVSLWGKNLADEVYVVDTLTDPGGSGWGVYVNGMPRTYGLSATYSWGQ
ncbi:MAG: TonB-dependent receptor domain-containing protein, partial [Woeseiaceae bacterium]